MDSVNPVFGFRIKGTPLSVQGSASFFEKDILLLKLKDVPLAESEPP